MTTYSAAPLDRMARVVTRGTWILTVGFAAGGLVALALSSWVAGLALIAAALVVGSVILWARPRQPVAYEVEQDGLVVHRQRAAPRRFEGPISSARRGRLGLRIAGDGGAYGYLGKFRADGKTVSAFVTSAADVVLLRIGESELAVSPADPSSFVAEAGGLHG